MCCANTIKRDYIKEVKNFFEKYNDKYYKAELVNFSSDYENKNYEDEDNNYVKYNENICEFLGLLSDKIKEINSKYIEFSFNFENKKCKRRITLRQDLINRSYDKDILIVKEKFEKYKKYIFEKKM